VCRWCLAADSATCCGGPPNGMSLSHSLPRTTRAEHLEVRHTLCRTSLILGKDVANLECGLLAVRLLRNGACLTAAVLCITYGRLGNVTHTLKHARICVCVCIYIYIYIYIGNVRIRSLPCVWVWFSIALPVLFRQIVAVCSQIHTKHINTLCGQNVGLLNVKLAVLILTAVRYT